MGRLALRAAWGRPELEFDSVHGRWAHDIGARDGTLMVDGEAIGYSAHAEPGAVPWDEHGVDVVLECSGTFRSRASLEPYFERGVRKVVVAAPVKPDALNLVMGVNDHLYDPAQHDIITAASCTTNCLAPVVKVIHEGIGIARGSITTLHDVTNTIFPELQGKLDGLAVHVPLLNASLTDCVFEVQRPTSVEEVNRLLFDASQGSLAGILGYEERPPVSIDYKDDPRSGIERTA